jgi:hypothetical protein
MAGRREKVPFQKETLGRLAQIGIEIKGTYDIY